ncbi:hypothetical protein DN402_01630 [Streptomyces sp. SW4]|nr:hypothetical protein DN402_01630 [Streptomyces sp. SW4]
MRGWTLWMLTWAFPLSLDLTDPLDGISFTGVKGSQVQILSSRLVKRRVAGPGRMPARPRRPLR